MASFLERYRQGEHEQVWAEMLALGGEIREQQLYPDVLAVARETMTRARANIELLVSRLSSLGYRFAHPDRVFVPSDDDTRRLTTGVERRAGPLPLSLWAWCEVVGEVNFMGSHPRLSTYVKPLKGEELAQSYLSLFAKHGGTATISRAPLLESVALGQRLLGEVLERMRTGQPRSANLAAGVRASREFLEGLQRPAPFPGPEVESDPLVVEPYFKDLEDDVDEEEEDADEAGLFDVWIAPDLVHKTGQSGGEPYSISFPDPAVDARLLGDEEYGTFVEYLRTCFRWGGFPGLRASANPPREELEYLTQGLTPL
jgi:hypothetical protein